MSAVLFILFIKKKKSSSLLEAKTKICMAEHKSSSPVITLYTVFIQWYAPFIRIITENMQLSGLFLHQS